MKTLAFYTRVDDPLRPTERFWRLWDSGGTTTVLTPDGLDAGVHTLQADTGKMFGDVIRRGHFPVTPAVAGRMVGNEIRHAGNAHVEVIRTASGETRIVELDGFVVWFRDVGDVKNHHIAWQSEGKARVRIRSAKKAWEFWMALDAAGLTVVDGLLIRGAK